MTDPAPHPSASRAPAARYATFAEFWPFYLREHSRPRTRALHHVGTTLVVAVAVFALVTGRYWWLLAMPVAGGGVAGGENPFPYYGGAREGTHRRQPLHLDEM